MMRQKNIQNWTLTTLDEAEEYTLMRAKEAYSHYAHERPNGTNIISAENVARGYNSASAVMKGWKNSSEHLGTLKFAEGNEVCIARYGSTWVFTVWGEVFYDGVVEYAPNNYYWN